MSLSYKDFDGLQDKREQIINLLNDGAKRVGDVSKQIGLKKATLDYHIVKLIDCGLIEEKYDGRAAFIGLTVKCRKLLRVNPSNIKTILQENGRKRKVRPELKIAALTVLFVLILGAGLFLGSNHVAPTRKLTTNQGNLYPTDNFPLPLECLNKPCPNYSQSYPIRTSVYFTNDFELPTAALGNMTPAYPHLGAMLAPRTVLGINLLTNGYYQWYTAVKVYDAHGGLIGEIVWNPLTMDNGYTCIGYNNTQACGMGFELDPTLNRTIPIILNRPLAYSENITVTVYYGNSIYGIWTGTVY